MRASILKNWKPVDFAAVSIAGALAIGLLVSTTMTTWRGELDQQDGGQTERIILSMVSIVTLYIGTKLANPEKK
jgi:hypothetical protein